MILNSVEVTNRAGSLLVLPLEDITSGLVVESIEGLDPVKATLVSSGFAQVDGSQYQSSRRESRNIKMHLALEPDLAASDVQLLRKQLYSFFMPKTEVTLAFRHQYTAFEDFLVQIKGRIETFESPLFVKDPVADIGFMCFDPDFIDPVPVISNFATSSSTTDEAGKLLIDYPGTVETGVILTLLVDRPLTEFTVYHAPPDGMLRTMDFAYPFEAGDVFQVNTSVGEKSVTQMRSGVSTSVVYAMSPQSNWLELQPGENSIRVYAEGAAIPFSIQYTNKYGGL